MITTLPCLSTLCQIIHMFLRPSIAFIEHLVLPSRPSCHFLAYHSTSRNSFYENVFFKYVTYPDFTYVSLFAQHIIVKIYKINSTMYLRGRILDDEPDVPFEAGGNST